MNRLYELVARLLACADLDAALEEVLDATISLLGADMGIVQLHNPQAGALEIVAQRGFRADFLDYFRTVRVDEGSASAQAMQRGERIAIEDVTLDPAYERHLAFAASAGYRAVASIPLKAYNGGIVGMLSVYFREPHRISERDGRLLDLYARHAADLIERIRFVESLKDADCRKDEFLATLAHELRNGLQVMKLANGNAAAFEQSCTVLEQQLEQMVRLINDLLDVGRISRGQLELKKERVQLAAVLNSAVETSRPLIGQMGHELTVTLPKNSVVVDADLTRLAQVFLNLLNIAAKYSEPGGHIQLTAERQGSDVVVSVDTGIGIAPDQLPRIFEKFSQVDRSLERSLGGLRIGLMLVRRLVEIHGGRIEAHSEGPGKGSEFVVRLPVIVEESIPQSLVTEEKQSALKSTLRILIVDDNRDSSDSLSMMLKIMGNDTRTAYDGQEAVSVTAQFRPDVILLDIGLPKLNGYEACRRIRAQEGGERVVIIAQTGWGEDEDRQRSHDAGFDHHMVKPVDPTALMTFLTGLSKAVRP